MRSAILLLVAVLVATASFAQEKPSTPPEPKNPPLVGPSARLAAAKTAYVKNAAGSEVPFNVISAGIDGWGKFRMVDSASEADIVIEVYSPDDEHTSSSTSSKTKVGSGGRAPEPAPPSNTGGPIRLVVSDPRTHLSLWSATEQPRGGFRQRTQDQHIVEAAQRLLAKFHERLEPPAPPAK